MASPGEADDGNDPTSQLADMSTPSAARNVQGVELEAEAQGTLAVSTRVLVSDGSLSELEDLIVQQHDGWPLLPQQQQQQLQSAVHSLEPPPAQSQGVHADDSATHQESALLV